MKISISKHTITVSVDPVQSPSGRMFRLSGIKKKSNGWIYSFKYLDDNSYFYVEIDNFNNFVKKWN